MNMHLVVNVEHLKFHELSMLDQHNDIEQIMALIVELVVYNRLGRVEELWNIMFKIGSQNNKINAEIKHRRMQHKQIHRYTWFTKYGLCPRRN